MTDLMTKERDLLELSIEQTKQMANHMALMYQDVKRMKAEMDQTNAETTQELAEIKEVQQDLRKNITLTRGEIGRMKKVVMWKSKRLTREFFSEPVEDALFNAKRGHTISYLWIVLKDKYNVGTYPEIPHVDFEEAMATLKHLTVHDFPEGYYRLTPKMKELAKEPVPHVAYHEF